MYKKKIFITLIFIFMSINIVAVADENLDYGELAINELSEGNSNKALEDINVAITKNTKKCSYYMTRANIKQKMGDYYGAMQDYNTAISINPEYGSAYYYRAYLYTTFGKTNEAISDYCMAIKLSPDYDSYNNLGVLRMDIQDYDGAIYDFNKAISINAKNINAYFNRGVCYFKKEQYEQAIPDFTAVIKKEPKMADAYFYRGVLWGIKKEKNKSLADFNRAKNIYMESNRIDLYQSCLEKINIVKNMR